MRLNMIVEGQTEEAFVHRLLVQHLALRNVFVSVRCFETGRKQGTIYRGGISTFDKIHKDLRSWMREDKADGVRFTTMIDLYRLPTDFPGMDKARSEKAPLKKVSLLEENFGHAVNESRFIPYIQLHEFEALLFSDAQKLSSYYLQHKGPVGRLVKVERDFPSPEFINDTPENAPSKRIIKELPSYRNDKVIVGPLVAERIGLTAMRAKCGHFQQWITGLELLAPH